MTTIRDAICPDEPDEVVDAARAAAIERVEASLRWPGVESERCPLYRLASAAELVDLVLDTPLPGTPLPRAVLRADVPAVPALAGLAGVLRDAADAARAPGGTVADGERVLSEWLAERGLPAR